MGRKKRPGRVSAKPKTKPKASKQQAQAALAANEPRPASLSLVPCEDPLDDCVVISPPSSPETPEAKTPKRTLSAAPSSPSKRPSVALSAEEKRQKELRAAVQRQLDFDDLHGDDHKDSSSEEEHIEEVKASSLPPSSVPWWRRPRPAAAQAKARKARPSAPPAPAASAATSPAAPAEALPPTVAVVVPEGADIARPRALLPPPSGQRRRLGGSCRSKPKRITPAQQLKNFPEQSFKVEAGALFCQACSSELNHKKSTVEQHLKTQRHMKNLAKWRKSSDDRQNLTSYLESKDDAGRSSGDTLSMKVRAGRMMMLVTLLIAGIPLLKLADEFSGLREALEYGRCTLPLRDLQNLIPDVVSAEFQKAKAEIGSRLFSLWFDGCSDVAEVFVLGIRFVVGAVIHQRLISMRWLLKSMNAQDVSSLILDIVARELGLPLSRVVALMRDGAAVNTAAANTLASVAPNLIDIRCLCHMLCNSGKAMNLPRATSFISQWSRMMERSANARLQWSLLTGETAKRKSKVRWFAEFEVIKQVVLNWPFVRTFVLGNYTFCQKTRAALARYINNPNFVGYLQIELAAAVDAGELLCKTCYNLEGDGFLAPKVAPSFRAIAELSAALRGAAPETVLPNVAGSARAMSGANQQSFTYLLQFAVQAVMPGLAYLEAATEGGYAKELRFFRGAEVFNFHSVAERGAGCIADLWPRLSECKAFTAISPAESAEVVVYVAECKEAHRQEPPPSLELFWSSRGHRFPAITRQAEKAMLVQPSSAAAERIFALMRGMWGERQEGALEDLKGGAVMLRYNAIQRAKGLPDV